MRKEKAAAPAEQHDQQLVCRCCSLKEKFQNADHDTAFRALGIELERVASDPNTNGRHRAAESLNVILHFFDHGPGREIAFLDLTPIWSLVAALDDLERGARTNA